MAAVAHSVIRLARTGLVEPMSQGAAEAHAGRRGRVRWAAGAKGIGGMRRIALSLFEVYVILFVNNFALRFAHAYPASVWRHKSMLSLVCAHVLLVAMLVACSGAAKGR